MIPPGDDKGKRARSERLLTLALAAAAIFFFYHKMLWSPDAYLFTGEGDGIKTYAAFSGHIRNDTDYTNYRNMNYPYGQTHIYTDGQTGISNILKFLSGYFPFLERHSIGIFHLLILLSFPACALFICLILQRLRLPSLFVILGSLGIMLLSPQAYRFSGHLTLAYAVFFPLSWWLLLRYLESPRKIKWAALIVANSTFWFFVHPYYTMMNTVFYAATYAALALQRRRITSRTIKMSVLALFQVAAPLLLTRGYLAWADHHTGRAEFPFGFFSYYAKLNTVFAPVVPPFREFFQHIFGYSIENQNWEGWAYIGLPSVFLVLYSVFRLLRFLFRSRFRHMPRLSGPLFLRAAVVAAVLALVFSMCLPFRFFHEFFYDRLALLQQFRSLGRFAWIFYYVATVYCVFLAALLYRGLRMRRRVLTATVAAGFFLSFFFLESYHTHRFHAGIVAETPNVFRPEHVPDALQAVIDEVNKVRSRYQCLIPFPYFNVGNENFFIEESGGMMTSSFVVSHFTNVPLLANSAARSPVQEGRKNMQFFTPPFFRKEMEADFPNRRPFLLLCDAEPMQDWHQYWIARSTPLFRNTSFSLYILPFDTVFKDISDRILDQAGTLSDGLPLFNGLRVTAKPKTLVHLSFEDQVSEVAFSGHGALAGVKKNFLHVFRLPAEALEHDRDYILSFWYYHEGERRNEVNCILEETDSAGNSRWTHNFSPATSTRLFGSWSLVERRFHLLETTSKFSFLLKGDDASSQEMYVDEVIVRPAEINVYYDLPEKDPVRRHDLLACMMMTDVLSTPEARKSARLRAIRDAIRYTPSWLEQIRLKAAQHGISVDSQVTLDAAWMYDQEQHPPLPNHE